MKLCCCRAAFIYAGNSSMSAKEHSSAWHTLTSTLSSISFLYIRVCAWRLASVRRITAASMKLIWASPHKISYE